MIPKEKFETVNEIILMTNEYRPEWRGFSEA
jgi:hypothetical protein